MSSSRRTFFEEALGAGGLAALLAAKVSAQDHSPSSASGAPGAPGFRSFDFWGTFFDSVNPSKGIARGRNKKPPFPDKQVRYLYYSSTGLKYTDQIEKKDLADFGGDVSVNISLSQLHLSQDDQAAFRSLKSSQLRLDC